MVGTIGIQPLYFLDEMSSSELDAIVSAYNNNYINTWEQTRYIAYVVAACNNEKIKQPQDLLKFSWDSPANETPELSKEDRIKAEQEMLEWLAKQ